MSKNRCRELRGHRSQQDIADFLGFTQQAYSNIENSDKPPKIETCIKLSKLFTFVRLLEVTISVGGDTLLSKVKKNCTIILFYIILHLIYSLFLLL